MAEKKIINPDDFKVKPGKKVSLKDFKTDIKKKVIDQKAGQALLQKGVQEMSLLQDKLYDQEVFQIYLH